MNTPDEREATALRLAEQLERRFLDVLNSMETWYAVPHVVAHASGALLGSVLRACVVLDPADLPFALDLLDKVRAHVAEAVTVGPGETRH
jgi:hypothetical protein